MSRRCRHGFSASAVLAASAACLSGPPAHADVAGYVTPWKTPWDYQGPRGPDQWGALDPDYALCNSGRSQSPIDIRSARRMPLPALELAYRSEPLVAVINNGHTIRVDYHDAPESGSYLIVGGRRYQLTQFHFHSPGEELIHGRQYPMVLHLMHKAADGEVAGVAVMIESGRANAAVQTVWDHMPPTEGLKAAPGVELDPAALLPTGLGGYYEYQGSLTAPPCTERVRWFVLKSPLELSAAQMAAFTKLYPNDARPPQPLNGRAILESE